MKRIAVSIIDGRTVRDLFYNGFLELLEQKGVEVTIFTDAVSVPGFVEAWRKPGIKFSALLDCPLSRSRNYALRVRRRFMKWGIRPLLNSYIKTEKRLLYPARKKYIHELQRNPPDLLLTTNALLTREVELIHAAHELGIPTLGLVQSWDNVYKGLQSRPEHLAVWNRVNEQETITFERYPPENVKIVGPPQFDPYFQENAVWPRDRFAKYFNLDPRRPIILFASLGYFIPGFDETCWMEVLLNEINRGAVLEKPQVICRLHPWSRYEHFKQYSSNPDVRLSYVDRYWPVLTWYMTRDDVILVANMIKHADVLITPGSTMVLEAAIFDTPTLAPVFHPYQAERAESYFSKIVFGKHFKRIEQLGYVPIIRRADDFAEAINRCLQDPGSYRAQRAQLVKDYVHYTDGRSVERLVNLALRVAGYE